MLGYLIPIFILIIALSEWLCSSDGYDELI